MAPKKHQDKLKLTQSSRVSEPDTLRASTKTIVTFELLEIILLFLDQHTLLCAQLVSVAFRSVIQKSSEIRKALFFEPLFLPTAAGIKSMEGWKSSKSWKD
jgi:hypothetical protein